MVSDSRGACCCMPSLAADHRRQEEPLVRFLCPSKGQLAITYQHHQYRTRTDSHLQLHYNQHLARAHLVALVVSTGSGKTRSSQRPTMGLLHGCTKEEHGYNTGKASLLALKTLRFQRCLEENTCVAMQMAKADARPDDAPFLQARLLARDHPRSRAYSTGSFRRKLSASRKSLGAHLIGAKALLLPSPDWVRQMHQTRDAATVRRGRPSAANDAAGDAGRVDKGLHAFAQPAYASSGKEEEEEEFIWKEASAAPRQARSQIQQMSSSASLAKAVSPATPAPPPPPRNQNRYYALAQSTREVRKGEHQAECMAGWEVGSTEAPCLKGRESLESPFTPWVLCSSPCLPCLLSPLPMLSGEEELSP